MKISNRGPLLLALVLLAAAALAVRHRLGIRTLTILRSDVPAAGETIDVLLQLGPLAWTTTTAQKLR